MRKGRRRLPPSLSRSRTAGQILDRRLDQHCVGAMLAGARSSYAERSSIPGTMDRICCGPEKFDQICDWVLSHRGLASSCKPNNRSAFVLRGPAHSPKTGTAQATIAGSTGAGCSTKLFSDADSPEIVHTAAHRQLPAVSGQWMLLVGVIRTWQHSRAEAADASITLPISGRIVDANRTDARSRFAVASVES